MPATPFLTDIDSRAAIKGSRDPLSVQPIWTHFGRQVVGNLTTASNSLRDFKVTLLGYYFVEQVLERDNSLSEISVFLKWEQLANYARAYVNGDRAFRGTDRVGRNLEESPVIIVSAEQAHQILSNQKTYGLWGLYSEPLRGSGLLKPDAARLEPHAGDFVRQAYLSSGPLSPGVISEITAILRRPTAKLDLAGKDQRLIQEVARIFSRKLIAFERSVFHEHLVMGGPCIPGEVRDRQTALSECLSKLPAGRDFELSTGVIRALTRSARAAGTTGRDLATWLEKIRLCESLLAPIYRLFNWLLSQDGQRLDTVVGVLGKQWGRKSPWLDAAGFAELKGDISAAVGDEPTATRWIGISSALATGEYEELLRLLLEQNRLVMSSRSGSAPWIRLDGGELKVQYREESGDLPSRSELPELWRFPYFIGSLWRVSTEVRAGQ